jgi:hypothetical protein
MVLGREGDGRQVMSMKALRSKTAVAWTTAVMAGKPDTSVIEPGLLADGGAPRPERVL